LLLFVCGCGCFCVLVGGGYVVWFFCGSVIWWDKENGS